MHVRVGRLGRRRAVLGHGHQEIHVEHLLVEGDGFLGVLAAIGDVMNLLDLHRILSCVIDEGK
jgi:hypothetical protein